MSGLGLIKHAYAYVPVPVYLDGSIETHAQLEGIIRHEIGHSLGLGHYIVSSGELQNIVHELMDMPSIMIDTTTTFGVTHYDITPFDISEINSFMAIMVFMEEYRLEISRGLMLWQ